MWAPPPRPKRSMKNRTGPAHPDLEAVDVLPEIGREAVQYIKQQTKDQPFFAYIPLTSPHTPIVPSKKWRGKSKLGPYGDFVMQTDDIVGQIVDAIDDAGLTENTLVIVTSDNGCSANPAKAAELEKAGHYPSGKFRGYKSDIWDGGHRVPFIVRWPKVVAPKTKNSTLICLNDLMATCADLLDEKLPADAGEDSISFFPALKNEPIESARKGLVHHSVSGKFAYREGKWKLILTGASGGWTKTKLPKGTLVQLYDMDADPGEKNQFVQELPESRQATVG